MTTEVYDIQLPAEFPLELNTLMEITADYIAERFNVPTAQILQLITEDRAQPTIGEVQSLATHRVFNDEDIARGMEVDEDGHEVRDFSINLNNIPEDQRSTVAAIAVKFSKILQSAGMDHTLERVLDTVLDVWSKSQIEA